MKTIFLPTGFKFSDLDNAIDFVKSMGIPAEMSATKKLGISVPADEYENAQKALGQFKPE